MQRPEPDRVEWNARDFGTAAHAIMELLGRDPEARNLTHPPTLHAWLSAQLDHLVASSFGTRVPLAVRVQAEALRQRLAWLARVQCASRTEGWEIIDVESKFEIPIGSSTVVGKIDRIDRHRDLGTLRVIDYKTGKLVKAVDGEHRTKITSATVLAAHLANDSPAVHAAHSRGKPVDLLWRNLQLPLYALALSERDGCLPRPCYFTLGPTAAEVAIHEWSDFSPADLDAARDCAHWLVAQIAARVFWPPADHPPNDDFTILAAGRSLEELCAPPPHGLPASS